MSTIYGALGIKDYDATVDQVGQRLVFDYLDDYATRIETELDQLSRLFVAEETTQYSETYLLPAGGMLQAASEFSRPAAIKRGGKLSVAYPIEDGRDQIATSDIALAYMTGQQLDAHLRSVQTRYTNWRRFLMLRALLNKDNETFTDEIRGNLTICRLANGDGSLYPAVLGQSAEVQENHYLGTNYAATSISDTNNPIKLVRDELHEHYGTGMKVAFVNSANADAIAALTPFFERVPQYVTFGGNQGSASANGLAVPGTFLGAMLDVAIFVWDWIPADYILGLDAAQPGPLKKRIDAVPSLQGFGIVATQQEFPLNGSFWRAREGYGAANRLNGVAIQLVASTSYTTPAAYV